LSWGKRLGRSGADPSTLCDEYKKKVVNIDMTDETDNKKWYNSRHSYAFDTRVIDIYNKFEEKCDERLKFLSGMSLLAYRLKQRYALP
jgi:hypothetical protein